MGFRLAPSAIQAGYRLEAHDSVGSTNAMALDRARDGDPGALWITALQQSSGRGRRGRQWATPHGNLAATLLTVGDLAPGTAATLGFVAGLALSDALTAIVPEARVAIAADGADTRRGRFELKWPNDVLAGGAKLAGILLESGLLADGRFAIALGIGVNVVAHPEDVPYPAISLRGLGFQGDAKDLFLALSDAWVDNSRLWNAGRGLQQVRERWLERAAGLGAQVSIRLDGRVARGTFETIDEDCRFVIREADGSLLKVAAGDVHFGAVASAQSD
ncbi:biotin--[acetyl-CoA-carboxylase] ligase [Nitratireductor pacificus]|uniref:biotin--[biotin carboxyl-carrier protein] ligase n=1 Tax=Nitratireductor pacificus pht-3B TaxID=391937 RepID=K2LR51_9HYPH|nr:biotin--[acetyl-CoA-carboxylase] ligase [Nitratireductor pacificus]EKF20194.1 biotin/acetyl-CoA-carboxylase ligase [Nitratireductor pacificus pht-3B]